MDVTDSKSGGEALEAKLLPGAPEANRAPEGNPPTMTSADFESLNYKMDVCNLGKVVIINNEKTKWGNRVGTNADERAMRKILNDMGFKKIITCDNQTAKEMENILKKVADDDHSENSCFICVILTHGDEGYVLGKDGQMSIEEIMAPFKGKDSLAGKPKLFFIQACGELVTTQSDNVTDIMESDGDTTERTIPLEADFFLAFSNIPGYFAWSEDSNRGSWFIQAIAEVFERDWQRSDLMSMMTTVNRKVDFDFKIKASEEYSTSKKKTPCITSELTKEVRFCENQN